MSRNGLTIWCVRTRPRVTTAWLGRPSIRSPRNRMFPEGGATALTRHEKSVVLPAPLGPITPKISPRATSKSIPARARSPSYRLVSPWTERIASAGIGHRSGEGAGEPPPQSMEETEQPFGLEQHHGDEHRAVDEEIRVAQARTRQQLDLQIAEQKRAEHGPRDRAETPDDRHQHDRKRQAEVEDGAGRDVLEVDREETASHRDDRRRQGVDQELVFRGVDAERLGGVDVLTDRREGVSEGALLDPRGKRHDGDREDHHRGVVAREAKGAGGHPQAGGAAREGDSRRHHAHRLGHPDRGNREIRPSEAKGRQTHDEGKGRGEKGGQRQRRIGVDPFQRQQSRRVGADPDEGGVADRDLAREASQQVPGRGQDDGEGDVPDVVQRPALQKPWSRQEKEQSRGFDRGEANPAGSGSHETIRRRETTRPKAPSNPCGKATSAMASSVKESASWKEVGRELWPPTMLSSRASRKAPAAPPATLYIPASRVPAAPAKAVPIPKATAEIRSALTPEIIAASRFCVTARIARPRYVRRRMICRVRSDAALTAKTATEGTPTRTPRSTTDFIV